MDDATGRLPTTYAAALRLREIGSTTEEIAAALDVPPESVDTLLRLAEAKLATLRSADPG